jgi:phage terminase large subunit
VIRGGDEAYIFKSFNPPKAKNNWANLYVEQPKENRLVTHTDYRSVPKAWLGKAFLDEAEYLQGINPTAYEHEYLGIANGNGGMVFENVVAEMLTDEQINAFDRVLNGVDFGYFPDPWAFNRCQYDAARRILYIFDELTERKKVNQETAKVLQDHGITRDDKLTVDSADPKDAADYCKYGLKAVGARKGPGSVDRSMKWLQGLTKIVIDPARCPDTYKELTQYEYERTKDGEIISGYPDKDNHHIDAVRYATEEIWGRVGQNQMERRRAGWN